MILSTCVQCGITEEIVALGPSYIPRNSLEQEISVRYVVYDMISSCTRILEL